MWKYLYIFIVLNVGHVLGLDEGDSCNEIVDNKTINGVCTNVQNCTSALNHIKKKKYPKICSFNGTNPIVCCYDSEQEVPIIKEIKPRPTFLSLNNTDPVQVKMAEENCPPMPEKYMLYPDREYVVRTTNKTGQIAWDKCIEYQRDLVFPCKINNETKQLERVHTCAKIYYEKSYALGSNGKDAFMYEFSHMALLGYGAPDLNEWLCGGAVISEKFILTAGHCVYSAKFGNVSRVATRFLRRSDISKYARIYNVTNIMTHPEYKAPSKYNDIALLEVEGMQLDEYLVPACLHTGAHSIATDVLYATGWGALWYKGDRPDILQKMVLKAFSVDSCKKQFPANRLLKRGYNETTQLCYGDPLYNTDTCDGDSGGPLQRLHESMHCMHLVIGVTSFGTHCGVVNQPAVYTKIEAYIPWIESVVWPEEIKNNK